MRKKIKKPSYEDLEKRIKELEKQDQKCKQLEKSMKWAEDKYHAILDTMPVGYFEVDLAGNYTFFNQALQNYHQRSYNELMGMNYQKYRSEDEAKRIYQIYNDVYRTGKTAEIKDNTIIRKDGSICIKDNTISLLKDDKGKPIGFYGFTLDITEKKESEAELQESREKYKTILETMEDEYYEVDLKGNLTFCNNALCRHTGYSYDELIGMSYRNYTLPEESTRIYNAFNSVFETGKPEKISDYEVVKKDGTTRIIDISISLITDMSGKPIGFQGVSRDVTERKRAVDALRESEKKYRNILENMEEGYFEVDLAGNYTFVNEALCGFHEYSQEELIGMNNREYSCREEAKRIFKIYNEVYKTGIPAKVVDYEIIRKDGSIKNMETSVSLLKNEQDEPIGFSGITRDVTEKKRAEKALRKSEERYRTILETMEEGYYEVDLKGSFTFFNPAELRLHGLKPDELIGLNNREFSSPETSERVYKIFNEVYRTGIPARVIDYEIMTKDGKCVTLETSAALIRDENGKPIGFRGISRDVTEKKKAENALKESEEKYRLLIENANDGIFIYQDNTIQFPNPRVEEITGCTAEELKNIALVELIHTDDKVGFIEQNKKNIEEHNQTRIYSFRIMTKNDGVLWVEMSRNPVTWEGKSADLIFLRDISQQKKIEMQLLQAQKMEALGTLAGGIAHDFNNLLMGIQGNASLVQLGLGEGNPHTEKLKSIEHLVRDGSELTKQLLGVARGGRYEVMPTNINEIIEKSAELFGRTRKEISIHKVLKHDLWVVDIDRSQIEQVLLNLYVNAWHAMPNGGDLYLETKNVTLDEFYTNSYDVEPGNYIRVSVTDNGIGMDENTRKRVFDPFFTTKELGRGTGLGLASAYGIIRNHKGIINVYSEIEQGTTFNMYLPVSGRKIEEEKYVEEEILTGTETILFVDDEDTIIEVGQQLLEILGYKVMLTKSGKDTLDVYQKEKENIDLIILDMVMPGMSGGETYDKLLEINPKVKVLLSSGYSINGQAERILERGCKGFIQKPFNLEELSKKIREVLET